jgi:hypothetical protein
MPTPPSARHYPELAEMWQRFASLPIRNAGTLGGNVANGSPIGDSMPWLIALGSRLVLRGAGGERELALEDFYLGYQQKDLRRANSCRRCACRCRAPACASAPINWPSASTRTSRPSAPPLPHARRRHRQVRRASPSAAWPRRPKRAARRPKPR